MIGPTTEEIAAARRFLSRADRALARAHKSVPPFEWRLSPGGFPRLTQLVIEQQVSTASAAAIWRRVVTAFPDLTAGDVLETDDAFLRSLGLSSQKARYMRAIAQAVADGSLSFARLRDLDDAEAAAALMSVKGVGRWTAEAYLMGSEGRTDIFPAGDLALQEGLRLAEKAERRLGAKALYARAEGWKPYRGVAAHLLWAYYRAVKQGLLSA